MDISSITSDISSIPKVSDDSTVAWKLWSLVDNVPGMSRLEASFMMRAMYDVSQETTNSIVASLIQTGMISYADESLIVTDERMNSYMVDERIRQLSINLRYGSAGNGEPLMQLGELAAEFDVTVEEVLSVMRRQKNAPEAVMSRLAGQHVSELYYSPVKMRKWWNSRLIYPATPIIHPHPARKETFTMNQENTPENVVSQPAEVPKAVAASEPAADASSNVWKAWTLIQGVPNMSRKVAMETLCRMYDINAKSVSVALSNLINAGLVTYDNEELRATDRPEMTAKEMGRMMTIYSNSERPPKPKDEIPNLDDMLFAERIYDCLKGRPMMHQRVAYDRLVEVYKIKRTSVFGAMYELRAVKALVEKNGKVGLADRENPECLPNILKALTLHRKTKKENQEAAKSAVASTLKNDWVKKVKIGRPPVAEALSAPERVAAPTKVAKAEPAAVEAPAKAAKLEMVAVNVSLENRDKLARLKEAHFEKYGITISLNQVITMLTYAYKG